MRSFLPVLACLLALLVGPTAAGAAPTLALHDPVTDNYKASYNADPSEQERRTWLAWNHLVAGGTTWTPADRSEITIYEMNVVAADGRTGTVSFRGVSGTFESWIFRVDPLDAASGGRWGPLVTVHPRTSVPFAPILFDLTLTSGGSTLATGRVAYRWYAPFATAAPGHIEHNGPGGRWLVGATMPRTDQDPMPSTPPTLVAAFPPRITSFRVPTSTTRRTIVVSVTARAGTARVAHVRFSIAGRAFSRWLPIANRFSLTLPAGSAYRVVRVQARDGLGLRTSAVSRRVRCACG